jgi:hypothetical protein
MVRSVTLRNPLLLLCMPALQLAAADHLHHLLDHHICCGIHSNKSGLVPALHSKGCQTLHSSSQTPSLATN